jgi:hypothetical protein
MDKDAGRKRQVVRKDVKWGERQIVILTLLDLPLTMIGCDT